MIGEASAPIWHADIRPERACLSAAVMSLLTFFSLFLPWLSTSGGNGMRTTAFGHADKDVAISGTWGVLIGSAVFLTVLVVYGYLRTGHPRLRRLVVATTATVAALVVVEMVYLNGQADQIRRIGISAPKPDNGLEVGLNAVLRLLIDGKLPEPSSAGNTVIHYTDVGLSYGALIGGLTAFAGLLCAATAVLPRRAVTPKS